MLHPVQDVKKYQLRASGLTQQFVASSLGIPLGSLSNKLNGFMKFTDEERQTLNDLIFEKIEQLKKQLKGN
jgi:hypothetical protein